MGFASEFKEFALMGSVMDMAVGVIIGGAFGKIVDSLVKDLIMPIAGKIFGGLDFSNYFILLGNPPADFKGAMTLPTSARPACHCWPMATSSPWR